MYFKVKGTSHYPEAVKEAVKEIADSNWIPEDRKFYDDRTTKEIYFDLAYTDDILFKYEGLSTDSVIFEHEWYNEYDPNAIKVLLYGIYHVGYVPKEHAEEILKILKDDSYEINASATIKGGPFKYHDPETDTIRYNSKKFRIGFELCVYFIKKGNLSISPDENYKRRYVAPTFDALDSYVFGCGCMGVVVFIFWILSLFK